MPNKKKPRDKAKAKPNQTRILPGEQPNFDIEKLRKRPRLPLGKGRAKVTPLDVSKLPGFFRQRNDGVQVNHPSWNRLHDTIGSARSRTGRRPRGR